LCNSRSGTIFLFPTVPSNLDLGFKDLQARGGFLVTAERKGGAVTYALVKSRRSGPCAIMNPWSGQTLYVNDPSGGLVPTTVAGNKYTFATTVGHSYTLSTSPIAIIPRGPALGWHVRITDEAIRVLIPPSLPGQTQVSIRLVDMQGHCARMAGQQMPAPNHEVVLNTRGVARGQYLLHVKGQGFDWTKAITLAR
jgi:hypothetical protein